MPSYLIRVLTKQLQLIEIEIADYMIAKNQGYQPMYPEEYYANLAHAYKGLKNALYAIEKTKDIGVLYVH